MQRWLLTLAYGVLLATGCGAPRDAATTPASSTGTPDGAARVRAAGRPRALPDPPEPPPPLPADPELVRLAAVPLPAELEREAAPSGAKRAG